MALFLKMEESDTLAGVCGHGKKVSVRFGMGGKVCFLRGAVLYRLEITIACDLHFVSCVACAFGRRHELADSV